MADVKPLVAVFSANDKLTPALKRMSEGLNALKKGLDKTSAREFNKNIKLATKELQTLKASMGTALKAATAAFAGAMGGAGWAALSAVKDFEEYGGAIDDVSQRLSVSAKALQQWRYAAQRTGAESGTMDRALQYLGKTMANAAAGANKNAKALFDKLGISLRNADGSLRATTDVMDDLTLAFEKNTNGALRTNMAMTLLGKSGTDLIPLLTMGKEGIAGFNDEMERYGLVLSDAEIKKAADLGDNFDRLSAAFGGMRMKVGAALSESFGLMADSLAKAFAQVSNNAPLMERLSVTADSVAGAIAAVDWPRFINGVLDATAGLIGFINQIGGVKTLTAAFGAYVGVTKVLMPLGRALKFVNAAFKVADVAKTTGYITLLTSKFAGLTLTIKPLIGIGYKLVSGPFKLLHGAIGLSVSGLGKLGAALKAAGLALAGFTKTGLLAAVSGAKSLALALAKLSGGAFVAFIGGLKKVGTAIKVAIGSTGVGLLLVALGAVSMWIYEHWDDIPGWIDNIKQKAQPVLDWFADKWETVKLACGMFVDYLRDGDPIGDAFAAMKNAVAPIFEWFEDKFESLLGWARDLADTVGNAISSGVDLVKDFISPDSLSPGAFPATVTPSFDPMPKAQENSWDMAAKLRLELRSDKNSSIKVVDQKTSPGLEIKSDTGRLR